jgi:hypothetical protein
MVKGTFWKFFKKITMFQGKTFKDFFKGFGQIYTLSTDLSILHLFKKYLVFY